MRSAAKTSGGVADAGEGISRLWLVARPSLVGMVVMGTVLGFVQYRFTGLVPNLVLMAWLIFMWACIGSFLIVMSAILIPRLRFGFSRAVFFRFGQVNAVAFCIGIVASVWILMPPADLALRMVMILLAMWFIAMVVILNPDVSSVVGAFAVVASMASFVVVYDMPYGWVIAGFLVMEGAALVLIRRLIWKAADTLQTALALVEAQRDDKTRFIAAASHDLRQPLQAAGLYFDQALSLPDGALKNRAVLGARSAFSSTQGLLDTMLDHLRLEADAMIAKVSDIALAAVVARVVLEYQAEARAAGMRISVVHGGLAVHADPDLLKRVLGNLVTNAVRHAQGERILLGARRRDGMAELWVIDDGCGVSEGDRPALFDDYARGDTAAAGGFGIGLASARRMVALMGGTIAYDPRWSGGAAFVVRLPLATRAFDKGAQCEAA